MSEASCVEKAKAFLKTSKGIKMKNDAVKKALRTGTKAGVYTPEEVAEMFVVELKNEINALASVPPSEGGLGSTAIGALENISISEPVLIGEKDYSIDINFEGNLSRPSMVKSKYAGIDNIVALLNNGYEANKPVHGEWHGEDRWSLMSRGGANFIGNTVSHFNNNRETYNIKDIIVDSIYKL